eukprot:13461420-Heterocapsa_arctica.AAC.1
MVFGLLGFIGRRQGHSPSPSDSRRPFDAEPSNGSLQSVNEQHTQQKQQTIPCSGPPASRLHAYDC